MRLIFPGIFRSLGVLWKRMHIYRYIYSKYLKMYEVPTVIYMYIY